MTINKEDIYPSDEKLSYIDKALVGFLGAIGLALFGIPFFIYYTWAYALAGKVMWGWFVVPLFGLPEITLGQAWGLSLLIGMWTQQMHSCRSKEERTTAAQITEAVIGILRPWLILFSAWICHQYFLK